MKKTYEEFMDLARELRDRMFAAETDLLLLLAEFEESGTWKDGGYTTFDRLLKDKKLCAPERYRDFVAARDALGEKAVTSMGAASSAQAAHIKSPEARKRFVKEMLGHREENGFPASEERARQVRQQIEPYQEPAREARERRGNEKVSELEAVVKTLKARVAKLEVENKKLEVENKMLRNQLGKTSPAQSLSPEAR